MRMYLIFVTRNRVEGAAETYGVAELAEASEKIENTVMCKRLLRAFEWPETKGTISSTDLQWGADDFFSYDNEFAVNLNTCTMYKVVGENNEIAQEYERQWKVIAKMSVRHKQEVQDGKK